MRTTAVTGGRPEPARGGPRYQWFLCRLQEHLRPAVLVRSRVPAYLAGRRVAEFNVPGEIGVVELSRAGHSKIPEPSTPLEDSDVLSFIVAAASLGRLRSFLGGKWS